jgi:hypothetical protein
MGRLLRAFVFAISVSLSFVPLSQAQNSIWMEPGGRFSLSFLAVGWTALPNERAEAAGDMLIMVRNDTLRDRRPRICTLSQRPSHPVDGGQAAANLDLDRVTASDVEHNVGQPVTNLTHARIGEVATLDYGVLLNGMQMRTRDFVLASDGQLTVFDLTCATPTPTTDDESASISALLDTLTINPRPDPAIAGVVGGWLLRSSSPGSPPCRAVKLGITVDTQLLRSRDGKLVLIAGHGDWDHNGGPVRASIAIDGAAAVAVTGYGVGPTFFVAVPEPQMALLRSAHTVLWHLPWGDFTADVDGLGAAFDAIGVCPG